MKLKRILMFAAIFEAFCLFSRAEDMPAARGNVSAENPEIELETVNRDPAFYIEKGDSYLARKDYLSAIQSYEQANALKKNDPEVLLKLGEAYRMADMKNEALNFYESAVKYGCSDIKAFLGAGAVLEAKLLYEKSEEYFKEAFKKDKKNPDAVEGLARIYELRGMFQDAVRMYKILFEIKPESETKDKLAEIYVLTGNYGEAAKYLTQSAESSALKDYMIMSSTGTAYSGPAGGDGQFFRLVSAWRAGDSNGAKKYFETLANIKDNSLAKKLALILYAKPR